MIKINDKKDCCGCTACKNICPKNAIEMVEDKEGFLYPVVNMDRCVDCGLCEKICPILNKKEEEKKEQKGYIVNHKNDKIRNQSTSGGAFTAIAEYVIENDGIVFGAAFDKNFEVYHTYVNEKEQLEKFRGSKYVQSRLNNTFIEVKKFLEQQKLVCYSGTPCQIEGLKKYLNREYDNLITVDIVCHAVPSPLVWRKYLEYQKERLKLNNIKQILFRDKRKYGYKYSTMTIEAENELYQAGVETDPYLRAFFGDLSDRPSCYDCAFKKRYRVSDFTIWDCFTVEQFSEKLDDDKGTSRVLIHSQKGIDIFDKIKGKFSYEEIEPDELVKNVKEMYCSVSENSKRKEFFDDINSMENKQFFQKYFPDSFKVKMERNIRIILTKLGIYKEVKRMAKKILKKN